MGALVTSSLLPPSSTSQERAIEGATARISDVPLPIRDLWNPDTCPSAILPWLAWQYSVDQWDAAWTDDVKRSVIAAAVNAHRHKGTVASIRSVLASIGFGNVEINEGRGAGKYDGANQHDGFLKYGDPTGWAYYRIRFFKTLSTAQAQLAQRMLETYAPARCHLYSLDFTSAALIHNATAKYDGSYKYGVV